MKLWIFDRHGYGPRPDTLFAALKDQPEFFIQLLEVSFDPTSEQTDTEVEPTTEALLALPPAILARIQRQMQQELQQARLRGRQVERVKKNKFVMQ